MIITEILKKKRDGFELSEQEINFFIQGLSNFNVSDIQSAAFLMACCTKGLSKLEVKFLTLAMRDSGKKFDFSSIKKPKVDKHSTGGVGDKISLLITPILMSFDVAVPMISGCGLGHTGGTVDKLESIVGFNMSLNYEEYLRLLNSNGVFMARQTDDIAPADKKLYHIRDVTGTVESLGLITASILSKKLVEDLDALVIDMKVGNGAFMQDFDSARQLAQSMIDVASESGLKMRVIFTSMEQPLGYKIGNWLEIEETISALSGKSPKDIEEITFKLCEGMLLSANIFENQSIAQNKIKEVWESGRAYNNFLKMIKSQGGDLDLSIEKYKNYPQFTIYCEKSGYLQHIDTLYTGIVCIMIGAGRKDINDRIDYGVGIILHKKIGDKIEKGEKLASLIAKDKSLFSQAADLLKSCIIIGDDYLEAPKLILDEWII